MRIEDIEELERSLKNFPMDREAALKELIAGEKIRHRYFDWNEYIFLDRGQLKDEAGNFLDFHEFFDLRKGESWTEGWYIY